MVTTDSNIQRASDRFRTGLEPTVGAVENQLSLSLHEASPATNVGKSLGDSALLVFMFLVGLIPVLVAASQGGRWGTEPTLGLLLSLFAVYQLAVNGETKSRDR